jgi:hypothetical protein
VLFVVAAAAGFNAKEITAIEASFGDRQGAPQPLVDPLVLVDSLRKQLAEAKAEIKQLRKEEAVSSGQTGVLGGIAQPPSKSKCDPCPVCECPACNCPSDRGAKLPPQQERPAYTPHTKRESIKRMSERNNGGNSEPWKGPTWFASPVVGRINQVPFVDDQYASLIGSKTNRYTVISDIEDVQHGDYSECATVDVIHMGTKNQGKKYFEDQKRGEWAPCAVIHLDLKF